MRLKKLRLIIKAIIAIHRSDSYVIAAVKHPTQSGNRPVQTAYFISQDDMRKVCNAVCDDIEAKINAAQLDVVEKAKMIINSTDQV